jgi:hypothetical protein
MNFSNVVALGQSLVAFFADRAITRLPTTYYRLAPEAGK